MEKNTQNEKEKENRLWKNEDGLREMQDNMKNNNIRIIGIPEGEEGQAKDKKHVWKNNDGKFPYFDERKSHTNPGNTESPNQEEPKEAPL